MRVFLLLAGVLGACVFLNGVLYLQAAAFGRWRSPDPDDEFGRRPPWQTFLAECLATFAAFFVWLFGFFVPGSWGNARKGEVFLLSGHTGSAGVLSIVAWRLSRQGFRVHLLAPPPGRRGPLEGLCRTVARRGDPAVSSWLLGYGIGGLFARGLAERPELGSRLRGIVTLGTPHRPTLAYPWRFWFRRFSARTTLGPRAPRDVEAVVLFSTFDASLVPLDSGYWPGAFHIRVHNVGHFGLLFSARAFRLVREQMEP